MLVLSRRIDEAIIIGSGKDAIKIVVVDILGNKIRLGIEANKDIPVHRQEVHDAIENDKNERKK